MLHCVAGRWKGVASPGVKQVVVLPGSSMDQTVVYSQRCKPACGRLASCLAFGEQQAGAASRRPVK